MTNTITILKEEIVSALKQALGRDPTDQEIDSFAKEYVARNRFEYIDTQARRFAATKAISRENIIKALIDEVNPKSIPRLVLIERAVAKGMPKETAEDIIRKFLREGTIYEPSEDHYKIT